MYPLLKWPFLMSSDGKRFPSKILTKDKIQILTFFSPYFHCVKIKFKNYPKSYICIHVYSLE